jgi:hypothetical protein
MRWPDRVIVCNKISIRFTDHTSAYVIIDQPQSNTYFSFERCSDADDEDG